jgi:ubiquitin-conjugating enzyme E2 G2
MKEYRDLSNDSQGEDQGEVMFVAGPKNEDDYFEWEALLKGPEGTPYVSVEFVVTAALVVATSWEH